MVNAICSVEGCDRPKAVRGLCNRHYYRWRKHGDPLKVKQEPARPEIRFWRFVSKGSDCWEWTGYVNPRGYGRFGISYGVSTQAHRFSYEMHHGPVPDGLVVMHKCDNRRCVNPDHLTVGTAKENTADMLQKGRGRWLHRRGSEHANAKLNDDIVREIRSSPENGKEIAKRLHLSPTTVSLIRRRLSWSHVM